MNDERYSDFDARDIIIDESAGYAVQHYCDHTDFKNPETARLWKQAEEALIELCEHLEVPEGHR